VVQRLPTLSSELWHLWRRDTGTIRDTPRTIYTLSGRDIHDGPTGREAGRLAVTAYTLTVRWTGIQPVADTHRHPTDDYLAGPFDYTRRAEPTLHAVRAGVYRLRTRRGTPFFTGDDGLTFFERLPLVLRMFLDAVWHCYLRTPAAWTAT